MNNIIIRNTTFDDIPDLRAMHAASWRDTYPNLEYGVSREWIDEWTAQWVTDEGIERSRKHFKDILNNPNHLHKVAIDHRKTIGFMHISKAEGRHHLEALYVDAKYHGTGLARKMMDQALDWAGRDNRITLEVAIYNDRAKAFYRKYRFREVPGTEELFRDIIPVITMERKGDAQ